MCVHALIGTIWRSTVAALCLTLMYATPPPPPVHERPTGRFHLVVSLGELGRLVIGMGFRV